MRERFEAAILANPDDLAAYAAFADWLAERGDPRGEFIRVQLALEVDGPSKKERRALAKRERDLLAAHAAEWLGPLGPLLVENEQVEEYTDAAGVQERPNYEFRFRRGFIDSLHVRQFGLRLGRALRESPASRFLRELLIEREDENEWYSPAAPGGPELLPSDGVPGDVNRYVYMPGLYPLAQADLAGLRVLRIGPEQDLDAFLRSPAAVEPQYGVIYPTARVNCYGHAEAVPELIERTPRLEELHLLCKDYDIDRLFASRAAPGLRVLRVEHYGRRPPPHPRGQRYEYPLDALADNPARRSLTHLLLHPHQVEAFTDHAPSFLPLGQVRAVLESPHLPALTHLRLRLSDAGDDGCRAVAASGRLGVLKVLDLRHGCVTDAGARVLAAHPGAARLELLDLSGNGLTAEGVAALRAAGVPVRADAQQSADRLDARAYLYEGDSE